MPVNLNAHETPTLDELAAHFGYDDEALAKLIDRQGGRSRAAAALIRRVNREQARFEREEERRRLDAYAADARQRHAANRADERETTSAARRTSTLANRLNDVVSALELASTQPGASTVIGSRSAPDSSAPPAQALPAIGWRLEAIRFQVERLEHELDAIRGHEAATELTGDQKDAVIILRFPGVHAADVAEALPELGSRRTIERIRSKHGLRPSNGLPHDDDTPDATSNAGPVITQSTDTTADDAPIEEAPAEA